jgi:hypothetical protein
MHIAAIVAAEMPANELAALNCCTAMNLHKAIVLPNPHMV